MKKRLPFILFILVLALAVSYSIYRYFDSKTKFNDIYVNGNTAGNLYNDGLFCESYGIIFFANPSDKNRLYSMDADGSNLTKLSSDSVSFINADEHYIYYARNNDSSGSEFPFYGYNTNSLCRIDRDGGGTVLILDSEPCLYASLVGNYIYYLHYDETDSTSLYKVKIDGTEKQQVDKNPYYTCSAEGQYLYFNGLESGHNIKRLDTTTDTIEQVYTGSCWMPVKADQSTIYYMNCDLNYTLTVGNLATGDMTTLCDDRVDCYNVFGNYIYFQRNNTDDSTSQPALCRIRTDGAEYEVIAAGTYTNINATSDYVYFSDYYTGAMYRIPTEGTATVEIFAPGTVED